VASLEEYGIDKATLREMYERWKDGASKSSLEIKYLGKVESHGKLFSSLVRTHLGIETERRSKTVIENERLRRLLHKHGIDPDEDA
jgi:hypothetical protein